MPRIYSYVITHDYGFAPNPFGGICTLATCKPVIRRSARKGDWLIGTGSATKGLAKTVIYAAQIDTVCSIAEYGSNPVYEIKRPVASGTYEQKCGDNIYFRGPDGEWIQRESEHHCPDHMNHDLSGQNVLIASRFWYFGDTPKVLPDHFLRIIKKGPGHKIETSLAFIAMLEQWLSQFTRGPTSQPFHGKHKGSCPPC
ncbi:hypothetical protein IV505_14765 [Pseudomonas fulva]|nr:hypothetical protein [Pseudomonas fulva]MBF8780976.1 hypothetical protein [Pseudomonas fulva]